MPYGDDVAITAVTFIDSCSFAVTGTRPEGATVTLTWGYSGSSASSCIDVGGGSGTTWNVRRIGIPPGTVATPPGEYFFVRAVINAGTANEVSDERRFGVNCPEFVKKGRVASAKRKGRKRR